VGGPVTWIATDVENLLRMRRRAIKAAQGDIIAVAEDHTRARPGWARAVLRAHGEHPDAPVVMGCLHNATADSVAGRANFLGFAAPFTAPLWASPGRPPPISIISFKREALQGLGPSPGSIEADLLPRLFAAGVLVADERIVVDHFQDHGTWWSIANAFVNTRASYGYSAEGLDRWSRHGVVQWVATRMLARQWAEAWAARASARSPLDLGLVALIDLAATVGALVGLVAGPGRAAERVA
jgi:hypothetical protein